jgi:hypothetical protein
MYSYHIFYFPFKWENPEMKEKSFSKQTCVEELKFNEYSNWIHRPSTNDPTEADELYNEKNYYYKFVHPVLYDTGNPDSILKHFERKEPQEHKGNVTYKIAKRNGKIYFLKVDAINLNLYSTGVGMLIFYLINDRDDQKEPEDILAINQFGRRVFPPFIADLKKREQIAEYISIEGLYGEPSNYYEDFKDYDNNKDWQPSCFITNLIKDLIKDIHVIPVIDDRMFVNCWYGNDKLSKELSEDSKYDDFLMNSTNSFWYRYVFIDSGGATCQNEAMKKELLKKQTNARWQKYGTLYGASHYSLVLLTDEGDFAKTVLLVHIRTIYSRMIELLLIQRASILKFSAEVTRVSNLSEKKKGHESMIEQISSLYRNYIRFVNQIYFREVVAQDQGIELYKLMLEILDTAHHIKDLDNEIEELHQYVSLLDDRARNKNAEKLNKIAAIFLPATLIAGIFGMNFMDGNPVCKPLFWWQLLVVIGVSLIASIFFLRKKNK